MIKLLTLSAQELAEKIRTGELKSTQVVNAYIQQIQRKNPALNALVEPRFEEALREAQVVDDLRDRNFPDKPLLGVPFTVKEMIAVEGMHSTLGSIHRKNQIMNRDATVVARLKAAGGILLGTTNVPELGFWYECWNKVYGTTNNPYDPLRTSGGSSGGEGAIIAAGGSPFGIGSDIGGSIRIPAGFCGVFGHKPSQLAVPFTGHSPMYYDNAAQFTGSRYPLTVSGPLARRADDLRFIFELIKGPDGIDPCTKEFSLKPPVKDWKQIKVYTLASPVIHMTTETEPELQQAVLHAGEYFADLGAEVQPLDERIFLKAFEHWLTRASAIEGHTFNEYMNPQGEVSYASEFFKMFTGSNSYTLPALLTGFLEKFRGIEGELEKQKRRLQEICKLIRQLLGDNGILIMPVHPRVAPLHKRTLLAPFDFAYTGIANALMLPASAAPMGFSAEGLPLGVQIMANDLNDHLCFSACEALERYGLQISDAMS